jgi:lipoate-protein ligase A
MHDVWLLIHSGPGDPMFNMAMDEALLEAAPRLGQPVLRFYGWTQPAASFGYFQRIATVEHTTALRPLVRRPTGGGIVPHDADWTYSVVIPPGHAWYRLKAEASYQRMHEWLGKAFERLGIQTSLAPDSRKPLPGQCFAGHERHDVLWHGRKVAGAAQRRTRNGLLIQGSVQPPPLGLDRQAWQQALCGTAQTIRWLAWVPDALLQGRIGELVRLKYGTEAYQRQR